MVDASALRERAFSFGPFRLLPSRQLLLEGERPVRLGNRSLEILTALVERPGELVTKTELMARVWPGIVVEEANLRVQITALRKALGEGRPGHRYVANVSGRGYRFVASVKPCEPVAVAQSSAVQRMHNLPPSLIRTVGRADTVGALLRHLQQHRLVSIVGAGGIGKTTVALAAADTLMSAYDHGIWFVDLAPLRDPRLVPSTLASALGLTIRSQEIVKGVMNYLRDKRLLILLDNCEHVIGAAASVAERIMTDAPAAHILATSREPLRSRHEHVHRLPPLASPPYRSDPTAAEALSFPAVQLFVERATASREDFELSDLDAPIVSDICRRLDGIALAIELAAARIDAFGIRQLAALLDDGFPLRNLGRRTAPPRQQTLAATFDWSYELLLEDERIILRRLSIFASDFTLESAYAVAADGKVAVSEIVEGMANLVAKSLISADVSGVATQYRLLDTTRAYALLKLAEAGEAQLVARLHAGHHRDLLARAATELETRSDADWLAAYGRKIDDVRAALDWAFSADGDRSIGVSLTVTAIDLWMHLSLWGECCLCIERALAEEPGRVRESDQMKLYAALSISLRRISGPKYDVGFSWNKVLHIAERLNDKEYRLQALWGLSSYHRSRGSHRAALRLAEMCRDAAGEIDNSAVQLAADRLIAGALFHLGRHDDARRIVDRFLAQYRSPVQAANHARFPYDQRVRAFGILSNILWLQGYPDQALHTAETAVREAQTKLGRSALSDVLIHWPLAVALYVGDWAGAERLLIIIRENLANQPLGIQHATANCLEGVLLIQRGDVIGVPLLRRAVDELREAAFLMRLPAHLGTLAQGLMLDGQAVQARNVIDEAIEMSERNEERWCLPELLRIKGELQQSEEHCRQAIDLARRQGALSWELRAATSLAQLWYRSDHIADAHELLSSVYDRFTEGYETRDLRTAGAWIGRRRPRQG
ncbi:MAG: winged helix-turn-helix domain-containing protein [Inquilinus limosus]|uniref:Winged helix-turn-helix domain-containing protein n=1 Tax=Inquilinus limosus TaxID=171674 RepID=A0A952FKS6_9PROT|nr:winged helix-turn-helix domain-containing protein [Inquilinus limosus]